MDLQRLSSTSHTSGAPRASTHPIEGLLSTRHGHFVDPQGRVQILRGVNLGGSSKLPHGYGHTNHMPVDATEFFDRAATVSFVNRPFPLEEADLHFSRLRRWGLTFLRLIVTWEAIEHAGPGIYDRDYLSYIRAVVTKAHEYQLFVYIDPHQDVWSRWTGGDGAPMWTLECVGLEPRRFAATRAALCMETYGGRPQDFLKMIWPTNYFKFACATMFTLFWSGKQFAPSCHVNGVQVQEFLQSKYLDAMTELAKALQGLPNVVGFGTMNEPSSGYIGLQDLSKHFHKGELKYDYAPTPFQGMVLADGHPQIIERWSNGMNQHVLGRPDSRELVDPLGVRAWKDGHRCIWMDEGVWRIDPTTGQPQLLKPGYFADAEFGRDFYVSFAKHFTERIRSVLPQILLFVELPPLEFSVSPFPDIDDKVIPRAVNATHWYDGVTLFMGVWRPYFSVDPATKIPAFGYSNVQKLHQRQLKHIQQFGHVQMNNAPTLIGETGIPFNLNGGRAYITDDYSAQIDALDNTITCLEANLLSYTLWCYTSDNCNKFGDLWNREDLSLVSIDQKQHNTKRSFATDDTAVLGTSADQFEGDERDDCARALLAFARPHATKIAGIPSKSIFLLNRALYVLEYTSGMGKHGEYITAPTEIYVPQVHYPKGYTVTVSDGKYDVHVHDGWEIVSFQHDEKVKFHSVTITTNDPNVEILYRRQKMRQQLLIAAIVVLLLVTLYLVFH